MSNIYLVIFILIILLYYLYNNFDHFYQITSSVSSKNKKNCNICDYENKYNTMCKQGYTTNKLFDSDLTANLKYLRKANKYKCIDESENEIQIDKTNKSGVPGKQQSDCQYIDEDDGTITINNCNQKSKIYILDYTKNHTINGVKWEDDNKFYSNLILRGSQELWTITSNGQPIDLTCKYEDIPPIESDNDCNYKYLNNINDLKFNQLYDNFTTSTTEEAEASTTGTEAEPLWFEKIYKPLQSLEESSNFDEKKINEVCLKKCNKNSECNLVKYNSKTEKCNFFKSNINNTNFNKKCTINNHFNYNEEEENPIIIKSKVYKNEKNEFITITAYNIEHILFLNFYPKIKDKFKDCNNLTSLKDCNNNTNCYWENDKCILKHANQKDKTHFFYKNKNCKGSICINQSCTNNIQDIFLKLEDGQDNHYDCTLEEKRQLYKSDQCGDPGLWGDGNWGGLFYDDPKYPGRCIKTKSNCDDSSPYDTLKCLCEPIYDISFGSITGKKWWCPKSSVNNKTCYTLPNSDMIGSNRSYQNASVAPTTNNICDKNKEIKPFSCNNYNLNDNRCNYNNYNPHDSLKKITNLRSGKTLTDVCVHPDLYKQWIKKEEKTEEKTEEAKTEEEKCNELLIDQGGGECIVSNGGKCKIVTQKLDNDDEKKIAFCDCGSPSNGVCFYGPTCATKVYGDGCNVCNIRDNPVPAGKEASTFICGEYKYPKFKNFNDGGVALCFNRDTNELERCKTE
jgi:hypothetical protein